MTSSTDLLTTQVADLLDKSLDLVLQVLNHTEQPLDVRHHQLPRSNHRVEIAHEGITRIGATLPRLQAVSERLEELEKRIVVAGHGRSLGVVAHSARPSGS